MPHIGPQCCCDDQCEEPSVECSIGMDGDIHWQVSANTDEAWIMRYCFGYYGFTETRIDLVVPPLFGQFTPDSQCYYKVCARNDCGEVCSDQFCGFVDPTTCGRCSVTTDAITIGSTYEISGVPDFVNIYEYYDTDGDLYGRLTRTYQGWSSWNHSGFLELADPSAPACCFDRPLVDIGTGILDIRYEAFKPYWYPTNNLPFPFDAWRFIGIGTLVTRWQYTFSTRAFCAVPSISISRLNLEQRFTFLDGESQIGPLSNFAFLEGARDSPSGASPVRFANRVDNLVPCVPNVFGSFVVRTVILTPCTAYEYGALQCLSTGPQTFVGTIEIEPVILGGT